MENERVLEDIATTLLFENDRVRVWGLRLAPGESTGVHAHDYDHLLVQIAGDRVAVQPEPDTRGPYKDYLEAEVVPGNVIAVERGGVDIIVELKD